MPLGGIIRMIVVLCLYAAILAKLADIEWGEALLVGLTTNVIFFIIAFMLLSGGGA